jgi:hypothetical protein
VNWRTTPRGFAYADHTGFSDGVTSVTLNAGDGKAKTEVSAAGEPLPLPHPVSPGQFFDAWYGVTVQLVNLENGVCWTSTFYPTDIIRNDGNDFRAVSRQ